MGTPSSARLSIPRLVTIAVALSLAGGSTAAVEPSKVPSGDHRAAVTPVTGPSLEEIKGRTFNESALSRVGGPLPVTRETQARTSAPIGDAGGVLSLTAADLYRMNCGSCHGPAGGGSPPEIKAVIGPMQATSEAFLIAQMRSRGVSLDPKMAHQLTAQAQKVIHDRLQNGGELMPSFRHLDQDEAESILTYLRQLAGMGQAPQTAIRESPFRVGEMVVKANCHTCHAATGPGPLEITSLQRTASRPPRPSLVGMAHELSLDRFMLKVHDGKDVAFPAGRGTMPVFDYLTRAEIESAFLYLIAYPPS
jgi:mono/diheme cytochrome c family protein